MKTHFFFAAFVAFAAALPTAQAQDWDKFAAYLKQPVPQQWQYSSDYQQLSPSEDRWWRSFGDATLDSLISMAERNNYNVTAAVKRIAIAQEAFAVTRAGYYPTVNLSAGYTKGQTAGAVSKPVGRSMDESYFNVGANVSWEIDVFGRIAAQSKLDEAAMTLSRADRDAVMVSLCANLATAYFQLRTYQAEYQVAKAHIASQERIVKMTEVRLEAGISDALEVSQARTVLYSTQATLPEIEAGIRTSANTIAVLTGAYPSQLAPSLLADAAAPALPPAPAAGIPADLLRRRPDVMEAEATIARYAAAVGVAQKDFLPTLALNGSIGTSSRNIKNLFGAHSLEYSVAPTLSWTLFDGMARKHNVAEAKMQVEAAIDDYNMTVVNAVGEVENALARRDAAVAQCKSLEKVVEESQRSFELSVDLYKQGLTSFTNVIDAQITYLQNQNALTQARGTALSSTVSIYQALGGGF